MGMFDNTPLQPVANAVTGGLGMLGGLGSAPRPRQAVLPDDVKRRLDLADALTKTGMDYSPIGSPWQGAARIADAWVGNNMRTDALQDRQSGIDSANAQTAALVAALRSSSAQPGGQFSVGYPSPTTGPRADAGDGSGGSDPKAMGQALANYPASSDASSTGSALGYASDPSTDATASGGISAAQRAMAAALNPGAANAPVNPYAAALDPARYGGQSPAGSSPAPVAAGSGGQPGSPSHDQVVAYITQAAQQRGIDPSKALAVAQGESGLNVGAIGDNGSSNGVFQLHTGGIAPGGNSVAGMGDDFRNATHLDPTDPSTWQQQVDFAMDRAKTGGWSPWHAAAAAGVGPMDGIGGQPQTAGGAPGSAQGPQAAGVMPGATSATQMGSLGAMPDASQAYAPAPTSGLPPASSAANAISSAASPGQSSLGGNGSDGRAIGQPADGGNATPGISNTKIAPTGSSGAPSGQAFAYAQMPDGSVFKVDQQSGERTLIRPAQGAPSSQGGQGAPMQVAANGAAPIASSSSGTMPYTTGASSAGAPPTGGRPPVDTAALLAVMQNPWASPAQQQIAAQIYAQQAQRGRFSQYRDGDGSLYSVDNFNGETKLLQDNHPKSPDVENYRLARSTGFNGSFDDYILNVKKAQAPQTTTNIDQRGESAESAKSGEYAAARRQDMLIAADKAPENISRLQLLSKVLSDTQTGPLAGEKGKVVAIAGTLGISPDAIKSMGLDPNQPVNNEIAQKLSNELVSGSIGAKGGGFPASNFSIAERQFLEKMFPNIVSQPGSNQAVADVLIAREQRNLDKADAWQAYKNQQRATGKPLSYEDFEGAWQQGHSRDNIFAPIMQKYQAGGYSSGGAPLPAPTPYGSFGTSNTPQATGFQASAIAAARDAISKGAPRAAVLDRLQKSGVDTTGF